MKYQMSFIKTTNLNSIEMEFLKISVQLLQKLK